MIEEERAALLHLGLIPDSGFWGTFICSSISVYEI